jgi:hypothetical protein
MKTYIINVAAFVLVIANVSAQNVGINTTTPVEKLDIRNGQIRLARTASYDNSILFSMPQAQLAGEHEGLKFQILGVDKAFIGYTSTGTSGNFLRLSSANANSNDLTIAATGNVGIGLNTPAEKLEVAGNILMSGITGVTLQLQSDGLNKGFVQMSGDNLRIGTNSGNNLGKFVIRTNGGDRVFVDDNGNMGIGVTDPAAKLHINSGSSIEALRITGTDATIIRMMTGGTDKANIYATGNDLNLTTVQSNGLLRLNGEVFINNTANGTGIGTTTPDERLHVVGNIKVSTGKVLNNDNINLLPIAYARFSYTATKLSGTSNITASAVTDGSNKFFIITVAGIDLSNAVAIVTQGNITGALWTAAVEPYTENTQKLRVLLQDSDGDPGHIYFNIVVFKP